MTLKLGLVDILQTCKSIRLVRLIGNTEGTVGIFVPALLVCKCLLIPLSQGKNLFASRLSRSSLVRRKSRKTSWTRVKLVLIRDETCTKMGHSQANHLITYFSE